MMIQYDDAFALRDAAVSAQMRRWSLDQHAGEDDSDQPARPGGHFLGDRQDGEAKLVDPHRDLHNVKPMKPATTDAG